MQYTVAAVTWQQAEAKLRCVREKVFVCEWRIPKRVEFDRQDRIAYHVLVCNGDTDEPVATGRLLASGEISRVAVVMSARKSGAGKLVLDKLKEQALSLNLSEIYIHSALEAVEYYRNNNFQAVGAVFMEAGIPRQRMTCSLKSLDIEQYVLCH
jgi:predicted GNAT family N-acyltransferase